MSSICIVVILSVSCIQSFLDSFALCVFSFVQNLLVSCAVDLCPVFSDHLPAVLGHSEYDPGQFDDSSQVGVCRILQFHALHFSIFV